jgi:hypothetical protein
MSNSVSLQITIRLGWDRRDVSKYSGFWQRLLIPAVSDKIRSLGYSKAFCWLI